MHVEDRKPLQGRLICSMRQDDSNYSGLHMLHTKEDNSMQQAVTSSASTHRSRKVNDVVCMRYGVITVHHGSFSAQRVRASSVSISIGIRCGSGALAPRRRRW